MARKKPTSNSDSALFRAAVGNVKVLDNDRHHPPKPRPPGVPRHSQPAAAANGHNLPDDPDFTAPGFADSQFFARPGLQKRILKRLTRGQIARDAEVDLHGMTVAGARGALAGFLQEAHHYRYRCVLIIHGKGHSSAQRTPVIKARLDRWLRLNDTVLAFCSAQPRDGGTGAVYVLLKSPGRNTTPHAGV